MQAELNRREAELRRLELEIRNNPGAKSTKNWPKFCPVVHHDIAGGWRSFVGTAVSVMCRQRLFRRWPIVHHEHPNITGGLRCCRRGHGRLHMAAVAHLRSAPSGRCSGGGTCDVERPALMTCCPPLPPAAGEIPAQSQIPVRRAYWAYLVRLRAWNVAVFEAAAAIWSRSMRYAQRLS